LSDDDEEISNWDVNGSGLNGQNGAPEIQGKLILLKLDKKHSMNDDSFLFFSLAEKLAFKSLIVSLFGFLQVR